MGGPEPELRVPELLRALALLDGLRDPSPAAGLVAQAPGDVAPRIRAVADALGLDRFDEWLLLSALAPELDARYERPTGQAALSLLCATPEARLAGGRRLLPGAPLYREGVLQPAGRERPAPARELVLDEGVLAFLLEQPIDPRLAGCRLAWPSHTLAALALEAETSGRLQRLARAARAGEPLCAVFHGPPGSGRRAAADALAAELGAPLLTAPAGTVDALGLPPLAREARLRGAVLFVEWTADEEPPPAPASLHRFVLACGRAPRAQPGVRAIAFPVPSHERRLAAWRGATGLPEAELTEVAARFRLTQGEIAAAADIAGDLAAASDRPIGRDELFAAARARCGRILSDHAHRIEPRFDWSDVVLPDDVLAQLRELCSQAAYRHVVHEDWGFDAKLGKGLTALFSGASGTGKTMAAEVLAHELGLDLYAIDLSQLVSKYIGETEKNLHRIFEEAAATSAILFFDEADALFGKRSEVKEAHDRYANVEISYLLQKMEEFEGIVILASNLRQNIDAAFLRRLQHIVEFPLPDAEHRRRIWQGVFPAAAPLAPDVDLALLARELDLTGGSIRSVAVGAAFAAAADGRVIGRAHLAHAARREYAKLGRPWEEPAWA
jgi:DNA polymerase III delta prime subunit